MLGKIKHYRNQDLKGYYKDFWTKSSKKIIPRKAKVMPESSLSEPGPQSRSEDAQLSCCSSLSEGDSWRKVQLRCRKWCPWLRASLGKGRSSQQCRHVPGTPTLPFLSASGLLIYSHLSPRLLTSALLLPLSPPYMQVFSILKQDKELPVL